MLRFIVGTIVLVLVAGCGVEGLHNANPTTRISAGPWGGFSFYNSKDVAVGLDEGTYDPSTKALTLKNLKITDNASDVRIANVAQIDAITRQQEAIYKGWENLHKLTMDFATSAVGQVSRLLQGSNVNMDTPIGSGSATLGTATTRPG